MQANAAAIQRLEEFGQDFADKLNGNSFDSKEPGSQMATMPEAMGNYILGTHPSLLHSRTQPETYPSSQML